jgi:hypothetical protein
MQRHSIATLVITKGVSTAIRTNLVFINTEICDISVCKLCVCNTEPHCTEHYGSTHDIRVNEKRHM